MENGRNLDIFFVHVSSLKFLAIFERYMFQFSPLRFYPCIVMYTSMYQFSPLYTKYEKKYVSNLNQFDFQLRAMIGSTSPRGMKSGERTCNRPISFWIIKRHRYSYEYEDTAATLHWSALYFSASSTKHFLAVTNSKPRARSKSTVGQQHHLHGFFSAATLSRNPK